MSSGLSWIALETKNLKQGTFILKQEVGAKWEFRSQGGSNVGHYEVTIWKGPMFLELYRVPIGPCKAGKVMKLIKIGESFGKVKNFVVVNEILT